MRRHDVVVGLLVLPLLLLQPPVTVVADPAKPTTVIVTCTRSLGAWIDPIVFPGEPPPPPFGLGSRPWRGHWHEFGGAVGIDESSTGPDLLDDATTCDHPLDHSAYWVPRLNSSLHMTVVRFEITYQFGRKAVFPVGVGLIAGSSLSNDPEDVDTSQVVWDCGEGTPTGPVPPDCGGGDIRETLVFPRCWDGVLSSRPEHVVYPTATTELGDRLGSNSEVDRFRAQSEHRPLVCPASHPQRLPQITMRVWHRPATLHGFVYFASPRIVCYIASDDIRDRYADEFGDEVFGYEYADKWYGAYSASCGHGDVLLAWEARPS